MRQHSSFRVALGGIMAALSLVLLYFSCLLPIGQIGAVAVVGLIPAAAVITGGFSTGFLCYGATAILGLLLMPSKILALLYTILMGLYPVLKGLIERMRKLVLEWVLKLVYFDAVLTILWFFFSALVLPLLPEKMSGVLFYYLIGNVVFVIYDIGVSKLITAYGPRLQRALRRRR